MNLWKWGALIFLLALDLGSKMGAIAWIAPLSPFFSSYPFGGIGIFSFGGISFSLNQVVNTGVAYGLFPGHPGLLFGLRGVMIIGLFIYSISCRFMKGIFPLWLIITGAIGNAIDYLLYGHVIDFFHFRFWGHSFPIFNLADSYITLGVVLIVLWPPRKKVLHTI